MMNKTWLLVKIILKMQYSKAGANHSQIWLLVPIILFSIPFLYLYITITNATVSALYQTLQSVGQESVILGLLFIGLHTILFIMSLVTILNAFFFAEDIKSFIPFPFQPYQLILGKSANPFIYLYITSGFLFIPWFYAYGNVSEAPIHYYLQGVPIFLLVPMVPFTLAAIILMVAMRFINISKNKDRSKVITGILTLAFIIFINVIVRLNTDSQAMLQRLTYLLKEKDGLLIKITNYYPPAFLQTKALTDASTWEGFIYFLMTVVLAVGCFMLFLWIGQRFYIKGMLGSGGVGRKLTLPKKKSAKNVKKQAVWLSYIKTELRIIFRTPTFLMQCVIQSLFGPVFLLIIFIMDSGTQGLATLMNNFSEKQSILVLFLASVVLIGSNATAISSVSRDGKNWFVQFYFPLSMKQILLYKISTAWIINLITITLLLIVGIGLLQLPLTYSLIWLLLMLVANWFTSMLGTYLDFIQPKLNWTDEQEVFKSRLIGLTAICITFGIFGALVLILWNTSILSFILTVFSLLLGLIIAIITIGILFRLKLRQTNSL